MKLEHVDTDVRRRFSDRRLAELFPLKSRRLGLGPTEALGTKTQHAQVFVGKGSHRGHLQHQ